MRSFFSKLSGLFMGLALTALPMSLVAAPSELAVGKYITEGGWGHLTLTKSAKQGYHFAISAIGGNLHICDFDGEIRHNKAVLDTGELTAKPCVIHFIPQGTAIKVSPADAEICSVFCGARAHFNGVYLTPAPGCADDDRKKTQAKFTQLYQKKAYAQALATLEPLLSRCAKTLDWIDDARIRNDVAITQYHLKQGAACQKTLAPLHARVGQTGEKLPATEQQLQEMLPPSDFDVYLPFAKATWHNTKLCTQALQNQKIDKRKP